jgi:molecular chaperone DnaK (HSP70)
MASQSADNTIIVGIDFGTTYSGVAFTWSKKIERMEVISSWDSELHSSSDEEKTPTAISFESKGKVNWGYNIPFDADQGKWFKLLLIDDKDLPEDVRMSAKIKEARAYLKKHNKTPVVVIASFLRLLWNHCNQRVTETVSRSLVNYSKFHIVITLPAIWPDYARHRMREAVEQAGMVSARVAGKTTLSFISEPEAAALATLLDMEGRCDIMVRLPASFFGFWCCFPNWHWVRLVIVLWLSTAEVVPLISLATRW